LSFDNSFICEVEITVRNYAVNAHRFFDKYHFLCEIKIIDPKWESFFYLLPN